jgi:NAD-dependent dihydropyrimidine dehydrogenase PreA subunit
MILHRTYYNKASLIKNLWNRFQMKSFEGQKIFKTLRLHQTVLPDQIYFYSPRLKSKPRFSGNVEMLRNWKEAKLCENLCPTNAIKVTQDDFIIDQMGCISCGLCVEASPPGLLIVSSEVKLSQV